MDRLVSLTDAASILGVSLSTLNRMIAKRELAVIRLPSGRPRISPEELERLVQPGQGNKGVRSDQQDPGRRPESC